MQEPWVRALLRHLLMVDGYEVALCDIKQEWAEGGKDKIAKGYARLVEKGKMTQEKVDAYSCQHHSRS